MERISDSKMKSKHIVICITGFLQESQDKGKFWAELKKYYKNAEIFAISWTACNSNSFLTLGAYKGKDNKD